jgi:hypothetical protein
MGKGGGNGAPSSTGRRSLSSLSFNKVSRRKRGPNGHDEKDGHYGGNGSPSSLSFNKVALRNMGTTGTAKKTGTK